MTSKTDAIIIGAGIIGCATAFELAKHGYKTLNIDKLDAAGAGSTGNSCAIVRASYSTWDGVAMAYEGFSYWKDWENYLGYQDEEGLARYMNCGSILLKTKGGHHRKVLRFYREIGVEHEEWDLETLREKMPVYSVMSFYPARRPEDERFWDEPTEELQGAVFTSGSGYVSDPQLATRNLMRAAQQHGAELRLGQQVTEIRRGDGRVLGVTLKCGEQSDADVVV